jgi:hypothetical protein
MTQQATQARIKTLYELFQDGQIPRLAEHEVNPGLDKASRENYLYFTLPVCINFQRSSPAMWQSALKTWNDPKTNYLFFPELLAQKSFEEVQASLLKHKLGLQPNKHTLIWTTIGKTFHEHFNDDPREVFKLADYDVLKFLEILQVSHKKQFPYLSGPKLSNYWPYILSQYTDLTLKNPWEISIIPDTHIIQCTVHLGLVDSNATTEQVVMAWRDLLKDQEITPVKMHAVLWNWSRNNFQPNV